MVSNGPWSEHIEPDRILESVAGTSARWRILSELLAGAASVCELASSVGLPRTTVQYNVDALADEALIERTIEGTYRLTARGVVVVEALGAYRRRIETGERVLPLLECVPRKPPGLTIEWFHDADVTVASRTEPHAPRHHVCEVLTEHSTIEGVIPALPESDEEALRSLFADPGTSVRAVVRPAVVDLLSDAYGFPVDTGDTGTKLRVIDREVSYGLLLLDTDRVLFEAFDERDQPRAVIETGCEECVRWATDVYEPRWNDATAVS